MFRLLPVYIGLFSSLLWSTWVNATDVSVKNTDTGGWVLIVDGRPMIVRGVSYRVTKVGQSPDNGTLTDWAFYDYNHNERPDGPYDAWIDVNANGAQDDNESSVGDFFLMHHMGVNTLRWYHNDFDKQQANKSMLRHMHTRYGIYVAVGDKFGAYTRGSGATWSAGTDYTNPQQRQRMLNSVRDMVEAHKDESYTLLWLLGNENNLPFTNTNAADEPVAYATLLNEAAQLIHHLDGKHPVALVNGDLRLLKTYAAHAPAIDIFGVNAYRGPDGFGGLWYAVKEVYDKPVIITEYGGSYAPGSDEEQQAAYHRGCWLDIWGNRSGHGVGNALGGFAYAWVDEWWKAGSPALHAPVGSSGHQGMGSATWDQEYAGITSQGTGRHSPFERRLRQVYSMYRKLWN
jgi:hypothetical protein